MEVGDLVKHKNTTDLGIVIQVLHGKATDIPLAYVRRFDGSFFPYPFSTLEVMSENR